MVGAIGLEPLHVGKQGETRGTVHSERGRGAPQNPPGFPRIVPAIVPAALLVLTGCVGVDPYTFRDAPAAGPGKTAIVIEHRLAPEAEVRATCAWKSRESGGKVFPANGGPIGCSWSEGGRAIVLCTAPKSFNDHLALEVCGHEAFHLHGLLDHF